MYLLFIQVMCLWQHYKFHCLSKFFIIFQCSHLQALKFIYLQLSFDCNQNSTYCSESKIYPWLIAMLAAMNVHYNCTFFLKILYLFIHSYLKASHPSINHHLSTINDLVAFLNFFKYPTNHLINNIYINYFLAFFYFISWL